MDPEGARIVWILKQRPQGGVSRLWGLASEKEGLVGATLVHLSRRELKNERAELERRAGASLLEVDWRLADFILSEAWHHTPENRRGQVGNFLMLRTEVISAGLPGDDFEHPIYRELSAEIASGSSAELLQEQEIAEWRLDPEALKPFLEEVNQVRNSPLVLNRFQQEERIGNIAQRALTILTSGDSARRIRRRLEDTAWLLLKRGRRSQAGWAAAAADQLRRNDDPKQNVFLNAFVRANLGAALNEQQEQEQQEPRLIMTPAEAMRARQQRSRSR
jgi:hypothetical protein